MVHPFLTLIKDVKAYIRYSRALEAREKVGTPDDNDDDEFLPHDGIIYKEIERILKSWGKYAPLIVSH